MTEDGTGVVVARPTLAVDGHDNLELSDRVVEMTISQDQTGLFRCEVLFDNWGPVEQGFSYVLSDRRIIDFGKTFTVKHSGDSSVLFSGRIMALEGMFLANGSRLLRVLAEDRLQDLRMTRRTRHFGDGDSVTDSDVIRQIANDHSLQTSLDIEEVNHKRLAQVNESDLAFLQRLARGLDADIWLDNDTIHVISRSRHGGQALELAYQERLLEFVVLADLAEQRTSVTVSGWDATNKQAVSHEATERVIQREIGNLTSGVSLLSQAIGQRTEVIAHTVALDSGEAEARANAYFRMRGRRFVTGTAIVRTSGAYRIGQKVNFTELDSLFNGEYIITGVQHLFDTYGGGLRTEILVERPGIGQ